MKEIQFEDLQSGPDLLGIKETKELLVFLAKFGNAVDIALRDGKISFMDAGVLFEPLFASASAFNGVKELPAELGELSSTEALELTDAVAAELDLANDNAEYLTERGLELAFALVAFISEIRSLRNQDETEG